MVEGHLCGLFILWICRVVNYIQCVCERVVSLSRAHRNGLSFISSIARAFSGFCFECCHSGQVDVHIVKLLRWQSAHVCVNVNELSLSDMSQSCFYCWSPLSPVVLHEWLVCLLFHSNTFSLFVFLLHYVAFIIIIIMLIMTVSFVSVPMLSWWTRVMMKLCPTLTGSLFDGLNLIRAIFHLVIMQTYAQRYFSRHILVNLLH